LPCRKVDSHRRQTARVPAASSTLRLLAQHLRHADDDGTVDNSVSLTALLVAELLHPH
jgi:hypothetical protein